MAIIADPSGAVPFANDSTPANRTEQVVNDLLVELVVRRIVLSGEKGELLGSDEGERKSALRASRAVARDDTAEIRHRFKARPSTVAAARIVLGSGI
jgi:hypothetical protein